MWNEEEGQVTLSSEVQILQSSLLYTGDQSGI